VDLHPRDWGGTAAADTSVSSVLIEEYGCLFSDRARDRGNFVRNGLVIVVMLKRPLIGGLLLTGGILALAVAAGVGWRAFRQRELSQAMAIRTSNGIDERRYV
jgi:hypothetical protein